MLSKWIETRRQRKRIRKWVKELRSGRWEQGAHVLRSEDDKYCCLGVACELFRGPNQKWNLIPITGGQAWAIDNLEADMPPFIVNKLGLPGGNPRVPKHIVQKYTTCTPPYMSPMTKSVSLSSLNDNGVPFATIADCIEDAFLPKGFFHRIFRKVSK